MNKLIQTKQVWHESDFAGELNRELEKLYKKNKKIIDIKFTMLQVNTTVAYIIYEA